MNKESHYVRGDIHMRQRKPYRISKRKPAKKDENRSVEDIVRELKQSHDHTSSYRDQSLKIHGLICAKCGREFDFKSQHLLTVHHKDGNHHNNPSDGSNWENLCIYCHDDEHSRNLLGDSLKP